jgi:hypothetical protein
MIYYRQFVIMNVAILLFIEMNNKVLQVANTLHTQTDSLPLYFYFSTFIERPLHLSRYEGLFNMPVTLETCVCHGAILKIQILANVILSLWVCTFQHLKVSCYFRTLGSHTQQINQRPNTEYTNFNGSDKF